MNYYETLIENLEKFIENKEYEKASEIIDAELRLPYVPSDILGKLNELKDRIPTEDIGFSLNDEQIEDYLNSSIEKQLVAVECLNHKNLRDYIDLCNKYLQSDGFINSKVLLIDSLIKQEIGNDIKYNNNGLEYTFIPKYVMSPEESDGYIIAINKLNDIFMKEPSKLELAKALVYKECIMALPINLDEEEGIELAEKIKLYVQKAFGE